MKIQTENIKRKNPINRNNLFFSDIDYDMQLTFAQEAIDQMNQTIVLFEVDNNATQINENYKEAKFEDIIFKTPVELSVIYDLENAALKSYDTNTIKGYYVQMGQLNFTILQKELDENKCDIKRGDYIGLQVTPEDIRYFVVADDGRVNFDNEHTLYGTMPYYRSIKCAVVSDITETANL